MADERQSNGPREGSGEGGREARRRYFRRRQRPDRPPREGQGGRDQEPREGSNLRAQEPPYARRRSAERQEREDQDFRRGRTGRRRRRTRSKGGNGQPQRDETPVLEATLDTDNYVTPTSVFIYTHVIRSGSARDSYEFRSEHFSKVGRRLEDYTIDLSTLFSDAASAPSKEITLVADLDETE